MNFSCAFQFSNHKCIYHGGKRLGNRLETTDRALYLQLPEEESVGLLSSPERTFIFEPTAWIVLPFVLNPGLLLYRSNIGISGKSFNCIGRGLTAVRPGIL